MGDPGIWPMRQESLVGLFVTRGEEYVEGMAITTVGGCKRRNL